MILVEKLSKGVLRNSILFMGATNLDRIANIRGKTKEIWKLFCQKLSEILILYPEFKFLNLTTEIVGN